VADAKKLLAGTPCAKGCTITAVTTTGNTQRLAELAVVASNLKTIGITLNVTTQPATQLFGTWKENGTLQHGTFEMALFAYVGVTPDPDGWKANMESKFINQLDPNHSAADKNQAGLRDKIVDQAFEAAAHSFNSKVRRSWYYKAQVEISKQVPWITLSVRPIFVTYDHKVLGVKVNGYSIVDQWNAYSWKAGAL
jgi:ABC-type transport system substrate-binding protein